MKKIIILIISVSLLFTGCTYETTELEEKEPEYVKSIWLTYYELSSLTKSSDENQFTKDVTSLIKQIKEYGFNTITVQVRPCADAFYNSKCFPVSAYFKGKEGSTLDYDPFMIICNIANENNIDVDAWINPYRVSQDNDISKLDENFYEKNIQYIVEVNKKLFFNPAYEEVRKLIVSGVCEIVDNYKIKSIHFDDYFYPENCGEFDKKEYENSKSDLNIDDWRRENVNKLIEETSKAINKRVEFGISPASDIKSNYNKLYADVKYWIKNGYIDYVCPQIYFGFKNEYQPFMRTVKKWIELTNQYDVKLYIGLPLYKAGKTDEYASNNKDIQNEFVKSDNIIKRQITYIRKLDKIKGYYIFSYSSLNDEKSKNEVSNMLEVMQDNNQVLNQNPLSQQ